MKMAVNGKPPGGFVRACNGFQSVALPVSAPDGVRRRRTFLAMGAGGAASADTGNRPAAGGKTSAAALAANPPLTAGWFWGFLRHLFNPWRRCVIAAPAGRSCWDQYASAPKPPWAISQCLNVYPKTSRAHARWPVRMCAGLRDTPAWSIDLENGKRCPLQRRRRLAACPLPHRRPGSAVGLCTMTATWIRSLATSVGTSLKTPTFPSKPRQGARPVNILRARSRCRVRIVRECTGLEGKCAASRPPPPTSEGHTRMTWRYKTWLTVRRR